MDQRGNYRWYEYRDVSTNVIDQAPQLSGNINPHPFIVVSDEFTICSALPSISVCVYGCVSVYRWACVM